MGQIFLQRRSSFVYLSSTEGKTNMKHIYYYAVKKDDLQFIFVDYLPPKSFYSNSLISVKFSKDKIEVSQGKGGIFWGRKGTEV